MLTKHGLRKAILERLTKADGTCNKGHIDHTDGVIRGLLWALTGTDHGTYLTEDVGRVLTLAGIEHRRKGDRIEWTYDEAA